LSTVGQYFKGGCPAIELNRKPASHATKYILPRKVVCQFLDVEIANQQLMDQGIVLVNALQSAQNPQLVEYDPRREGWWCLSRGPVPFSRRSGYPFLSCLSPKCRIRSKQSDSVSQTIEQGMQIEPQVFAKTTIMTAT
jgi:hypothetical protein